VSRQLVLFLVAMQFLTRLPTPAIKGFESGWLSQSARYFPLVGVLIGVINVGVWWLSIHWLPAGISVGLMLAGSLLVTGAFHEDGFADACDGLGGGTTPERMLAIMKDSRIGAYGAMGIFLMLGLKWAALTALPPASFALIVIGAHMFSRFCALGLIWRLPYARRDGDAKAKPFADNLSAREWIASGVIGLLGLGPVAFACAELSGAFDGQALAAAVAVASIAALTAAVYFQRRLGGYTGDCLGAIQQLTELAFLLGAIAAVNPARRIG
jgi:adenosylcobinamide-GDP ribazoletransferase